MAANSRRVTLEQARPIAVRAQAPIYAADEVIEESAIEFEGEASEEEIVDEFKKFLDRVSAEDFAEAEVDEEDD